MSEANNNCRYIWNAASWGSCSAACGNAGMQTRRPTLISGDSTCRPMVASQSRPCNRFPCTSDCQYIWSDWSACSQPCGGGTQTRNPTVIAQPVFAGKQCPQPETRVCNTQSCPTNCDYDWSDWTECVNNQNIPVTCGGGKQSRTPVVRQNSAGGGLPCPGVEWRLCNLTPCD